MSTVQTSTDVILRDGSTLGCARPGPTTPTRCSTSPGRSRSGPLPPLPRLPESWAPPGRAAARARLGRARRAARVARRRRCRARCGRRPATSDCATRRRRSRRSRSRTTSRAAASARGCSSSSRRVRPSTADRALRGGGAGGQPRHARRSSPPASRSPRALGQRGRGAFPDRRHRALPRAGRTARPRGGPRIRSAPSSSRWAAAVVGASRRRGSIGGELFRNILAADFLGAAYPVNREASPSRACSRTARSPTSRRT